MKVEVIRGAGDKQAEDIIDALCTAESAGLQRGRNYLDENGFDKTIYDMNLSYRLLPLPGAVAEVSDASLGQTFRGKIIAWSMQIDAMDAGRPASITTSLSVERSIGA